MKELKLNRVALFSMIVLIMLNPTFTVKAQEVIPPKCYGGNRLTREFIQEEMIYPAKAMESETEGTVILSFVILPDGSVSTLNVLQKVSPELDQEAIRIFQITGQKCLEIIMKNTEYRFGYLIEVLPMIDYIA